MYKPLTIIIIIINLVIVLQIIWIQENLLSIIIIFLPSNLNKSNYLLFFDLIIVSLHTQPHSHTHTLILFYFIFWFFHFRNLVKIQIFSFWFLFKFFPIFKKWICWRGKMGTARVNKGILKHCLPSVLFYFGTCEWKGY